MLTTVILVAQHDPQLPEQPQAVYRLGGSAAGGGGSPQDRRYIDHLLHRRRCPKTINCHLNSIRRFGRLHELSMILEHKLTSRDLLSNLDMGIDMFVKGKIHPLPKRIQGMDEVKKLFEMGGEDGGGREGW